MEDKQYAIGPDGRIVRYEPHHQTLKPGWREATAADIATKAVERLKDAAAEIIEIALGESQPDESQPSE
jgi:hypothetical protein